MHSDPKGEDDREKREIGAYSLAFYDFNGTVVNININIIQDELDLKIKSIDEHDSTMAPVFYCQNIANTLVDNGHCLTREID